MFLSDCLLLQGLLGGIAEPTDDDEEEQWLGPWLALQQLVVKVGMRSGLAAGALQHVAGRLLAGGM